MAIIKPNSETNALWYAMRNAKYRNTLNQLHEIDTNPCTDMAEFMSEIVTAIVQSMHAQAGVLWYYSKYATGRIYPKAFCGGLTPIEDGSIALGEGVPGKTITTGKPILIENCKTDKEWADKVESIAGLKMQSIVCVPLVDGEKCFGCLQLINTSDGFYDQTDLRYLERIAVEVSRMFRKHAKDILMGCFSAFDDLDKAGLNSAINCETLDEMVVTLHHIPQYADLTKFEARLFEWCCCTIWKMFDRHRK